MPIKTFGDSATEAFFISGQIRKGTKWAAVKKIAGRKLDILNYAARLGDLRSPPGNNLEQLSGDLIGNYSIRINDQWRIVFRWTANGSEDVRIIDYHK